METRIAIFDDSKNLRDSVSLLLSTEKEFRVVGSFAHVNNCLNDIAGCMPHIILMDIEMPGLKGTEAVSIIKKRYPHIFIIMQTVFDDDDKVFQSICAGATSYILKNQINFGLIQAIYDILQGGAAISPSIAKKILLKMQKITAAPTLEDSHSYNLSSREKEVLACVVNGLPHKAIAAELNISYDTVRTHIKNIYAKLHVASLSELVSKTLYEKII